MRKEMGGEGRGSGVRKDADRKPDGKVSHTAQGRVEDATPTAQSSHMYTSVVGHRHISESHRPVEYPARSSSREHQLSSAINAPTGTPRATALAIQPSQADQREAPRVHRGHGHQREMRRTGSLAQLMHRRSAISSYHEPRARFEPNDERAPVSRKTTTEAAIRRARKGAQDESAPTE